MIGLPLPAPRGPLSAALFDAWTNDRPGPRAQPIGGDPRTDDDLHLALWSCYHLHFGGFSGVADRREWDATTIAFRTVLEDAFEGALRDDHHPDALPGNALTALRVISEWSGPPLSAHIEQRGTRAQLEEFVIHRSAYQLKEADAHTFALPRLRGPGRSAMIAIQTDEYGNGVSGQSHSELFAAAMEELGLDARLGGYLDLLPGTTLATDNLVSMFGLHRRLRWAALGHLALFEMTSVVPMSRYLAAARCIEANRLARFYEVHVSVDAHHAQLALQGMVRPAIEAEPGGAADVIFGAAALSRVESRFARHLLDRWDRGASSLRADGARHPTSTSPASWPLEHPADRPTTTPGRVA